MFRRWWLAAWGAEHLRLEVWKSGGLEGWRAGGLEPVISVGNTVPNLLGGAPTNPGTSTLIPRLNSDVGPKSRFFTRRFDIVSPTAIAIVHASFSLLLAAPGCPDHCQHPRKEELTRNSDIYHTAGSTPLQPTNCLSFFSRPDWHISNSLAQMDFCVDTS